MFEDESTQDRVKQIAVILSKFTALKLLALNYDDSSKSFNQLIIALMDQPQSKLFQTVRKLKLRQQNIQAKQETNQLLSKFISQFDHLDKLHVSCVYNPMIPLHHCKKGQVDRIKIILDKGIDEEFIERFTQACLFKEIKSL